MKSRLKEEQQAPVVVKIPVSGQCKSMFLKRWSWCEWVGERRLRRTSITAAHWELWAVCAKECAAESLFCAFSPRAPSPLGKDFVLAEKCGVRGKHKCAEMPNTNVQKCRTQMCRNAKHKFAEMPNTSMKECKTSLVCRNELCWWVISREFCFYQ